MTAHMLIQLPSLALIGYAVGRRIPTSLRDRCLALAGSPVPLVLVAAFTTALWMLPRALDAALVDPLWEAAKFVSLPLALGLPLAVAAPSLGHIGWGFVVTNLASMLAVVGWLYAAAPTRMCNSYSNLQQLEAGTALIGAALGLAGVWVAGLFTGAFGGGMGRRAPGQTR